MAGGTLAVRPFSRRLVLDPPAAAGAVTVVAPDDAVPGGAPVGWSVDGGTVVPFGEPREIPATGARPLTLRLHGADDVAPEKAADPGLAAVAEAAPDRHRGARPRRAAARLDPGARAAVGRDVAAQAVRRAGRHERREPAGAPGAERAADAEAVPLAQPRRVWADAEGEGDQVVDRQRAVPVTRSRS